jgi:DNA-binding winged helix-turn-helix (wHTH) protein
MPATPDALLAFAHRLLCAAAIAQAYRRSCEVLRRPGSPDATRALARIAAAPEGLRLANFVDERSGDVGAAVGGADGIEARERVAIWSHGVAEAALARALGARFSEAELLGGWSLEFRQGRAVFTHPRAVLSAREFALLRALMRHAGITLTREQLLQHAWPDEPRVAANTVDVYVGYLRRKLGTSTIKTVRGVGYRLERETAEALRLEPRRAERRTPDRF